jgi:hypothetical protein
MSVPSGAPPINYDNPHLYEHLAFIVDEFEKAALRSGTRQGMLVTAQGPLQAMDMVLASSAKALAMGRTANAKRVSDPEETDAGAQVHNDINIIAADESGELQTEGCADSELGNETVEIKPPSFVVGTSGSIGFDADVNDLLNGPHDSSKKIDALGDYLSECLGCDLRLTFDWQLQPLDLLGSVGDLLGDINLALDKFEGFLDPFDYLVDLCDLLNGLNFLCIPDLVMILMSLKMLLKSYLTFQLGLKIDWTLLIGPLLKLILGAISTLLQQIAGIIVAPLDCAYAALMTVAKLQDELVQTAAVANAVATRAADRVTGGGDDGVLDDFEGTVDSRWKNLSPDSETVDARNDKFDIDIPAVSSSTSVGSSETFVSVIQGFEIDANTTLPEAVESPDFTRANPFKKLALTVREAKNFIMSLVRKILLANDSLQGLVSGSLGLSLGNLGLLLFVKDQVNMILLIIKLLSQNRDVGDWCSYLEENPAILERELNGLRVVPTKESLQLVLGAEVVGEVKTCFNDRSPTQNALLKQWVADLKRDGSS